MTEPRPLFRIPTSLRRAAALGALASLASLTMAAKAGAVEAEACVDAYETGQKLRSEGSLLAAKERFLVCADPSCPAITKSDCTNWVNEVDQSLPTVIFAVTDRTGKDVTQARISVDGKLLSGSVDGKAAPLDPGSRKIVVEIEGEPPLERELVVRQGEKNRKIDLSFAPEKAGGSASSSEGGGISPATWVLGGIGIAGIAVFATFGALGLSEKSDAETRCAPNCSDDDVSSIRTKFLVGDIGLGVGVASLAAAVIVGIVSASGGGDEVAALPVRIGGAPAPGGGLLVLEGAF